MYIRNFIGIHTDPFGEYVSYNVPFLFSFVIFCQFDKTNIIRIKIYKYIYFMMIRTLNMYYIDFGNKVLNGLMKSLYST